MNERELEWTKIVKNRGKTRRHKRHLERERDRAAGDRPAIGVKSGIAGYFGVSSITKKKACLEYYKNESYK